MRVDVVGVHGFEVTDAIRSHAVTKADKLPKHFDGIQLITVRLWQESHTHRPQFKVELVVDVVKHDDFVTRVEDPDLYAAIDQAVQKGARQLTEFKERLKGG